MNKLAGNIVKSWTLNFYDNHNRNICSSVIQPWDSDSNIYNLSGFGRDIELEIDGNQLKFNTMKSLGAGAEMLSVDLVKHDLTVTFNG